MAKALLVVDIQKGYIEKYPHSLLTNINKRLEAALDDKELILYIKNTKKLRSGKKTNELVEGLRLCSEYIICKETASAFSNSELQKILKKNQITEIEIAGIDGNSCIASTAMDSAKNGYQTILRYKNIGVQNAERFEKTKIRLWEKGVIVLEE